MRNMIPQNFSQEKDLFKFKIKNKEETILSKELLNVKCCGSHLYKKKKKLELFYLLCDVIKLFIS